MGSGTYKEIDLYDPVKDYLEEEGYRVRGEVKNCDIVATKGEDLVVIELKKNLSVELLVQATDRQKITTGVYIGIPRPKIGLNSARWKGIRRLLGRLELGLIFVAMDSPLKNVEVVFHPLPYKKAINKRTRDGIIKEAKGRFRDRNKGGGNRQKLMTAYRENAIFIACCLARLGQASAAQLKTMGTGDKTYSILYNNYYGWFERVSRGIYNLSEKGRAALLDYPKEAKHYRKAVEDRILEMEKE